MEFVQLPQEVLLELFQYLNLKDLNVLSQTSTSLFHLTEIKVLMPGNNVIILFETRNDEKFWKSRAMSNLRDITSREQANKFMEEWESKESQKLEKKEKKFKTSYWKKIVDVYTVLSKERRWIPKDRFTEKSVVPHWEAFSAPAEFRVSVMGKERVGKSALTIRFVSRQFVVEYDPTIEDSYRKTVRISSSKRDHIIDILDTAGQVEYAAMQYSCIQVAKGFILVFDITSAASFKHISNIITEMKSVKKIDDLHSVPIVLVGNKIDCEAERQVSPVEGLLLAKELGAPYFETSANREVNVDNLFHQILFEILWKDYKYGQPQHEKFKKPKDKHCIIS